MENKNIEIIGARAHNLQNIDVSIPRNALIVITGLSGSGKSSLAFDTIYAEGQRRYMETFPAYARQFIGSMERPDVDKITGLSPVISIEQKTTNKNPRSTVGTVTEVYDYLRLLYARIGEAYSYNTGEKMVKYSEKQIQELILEQYANQSISILAPLIVGRKGHYRELFEHIRKLGYLKARIDGQLCDLVPQMQVDRYKTHDIEVLIDKFSVKESQSVRLSQSIMTALKLGKGVLLVLNEEGKAAHFSRYLMCPSSGISYPEPEPNTFSFNSPYGACPHCDGLGLEAFPDMEKIIPDPRLSIKNGGLAPYHLNEKTKFKNEALGYYWVIKQLELIAKFYNFTLDTPINKIPKEGMQAILEGFNTSFEKKNEYMGVTQKYKIDFKGIYKILNVFYKDERSYVQKWAEQYLSTRACEHCGGSRLQKSSLYFKVGGKNIWELSQMNLSDLYHFLDQAEASLSGMQEKVGHEIIKEIKTRLSFLLNVGLSYLHLHRNSGSLSGGEAQRIRLATQIGSKLVNVLYILDEPSIGLHQKDNFSLIESLKALRDIGNSVIVVEHDKDMMLSADYIIDIGPGAGIHGGKITAKGDIKSFIAQNSITAKYLSNKLRIEIPEKRRKGNGLFIELNKCSGNNLKNVDLKIPLGCLCCVSGVSGSGKSSLIKQTLYPILAKHFYRSNKEALPYKSIQGVENIDKIIVVDQSPIGRTPRSNPATYIGVFEDIRKLFASLPEAKIRDYQAGRFSFNVKGGRCETCMGAGVKTIEMHFLPDVHVVCEECYGKRYNKETLQIRYKGKSISDVLDMTIEQAVDFFENIPHIQQKLVAIKNVGLGYICLGQPATTLSGGEAQRVKLAEELSKRASGKTLYLLDEPTTGLHFEDIRILLKVIQQLVDHGNSVVIIEHNMDIIKSADYIIDVGPEGGRMGGEILCTGTPEEIITCKKSHTAMFLAKELS